MFLKRLRDGLAAGAVVVGAAVPVVPRVAAAPKAAPRGSVIADRDVAKSTYTAKQLFIDNHCQTLAAENFDSVDRAEYQRRRTAGAARWDAMSSAACALWEAKAREHDERHADIKPLLLRALKKNPTMSWERLAGAIDNWCSPSTIQRWMKSHVSYSTYSEMIVPLLSAPQKAKHLAFAQRLRQNWYGGGGKYLLIHYDEKWF